MSYSTLLKPEKHRLNEKHIRVSRKKNCWKVSDELINCYYGHKSANTLMNELCELYDNELTFSSVSHPKLNDSIEGFHETLSEIIKSNLTENAEEHLFNVIPYTVKVKIIVNLKINSTYRSYSILLKIFKQSKN